LAVTSRFSLPVVVRRLSVGALLIGSDCREKMKIPPNVVDELIKGTNSDIRQVLNMLSTFKLGKSEMDFDEGKQLCVVLAVVSSI
jgi:replication factor C subunit 1